MAMLQAMRHHIMRALVYSEGTQHSDIPAEMQAEDEALERRLEKLEAFARSIDLVDAIRRLERIEALTHGIGLAGEETIKRLQRAEEKAAELEDRFEAYRVEVSDRIDHVQEQVDTPNWRDRQ